MRILIIEDEIPAYEKLKSFLVELNPDHEIIGWGRSVEEFKNLLTENLKPDLIISDIELLDGNSFELFESQKIETPIIFCTAFDQYLMQAFKTNGIAYILKPYTIDNLKEALDKYKGLFPEKNTSNLSPDLVRQLKQMLEQGNTNFKQRFSVKKKDGIKLLNVEDIGSFEANGDFSFAYDDKGQKHVINFSLGKIEAKVDSNKFFRINRSEIVNIDYINNIAPHFKNRLGIKLMHREIILHTSLGKTPAFRSWLEK